MDALCCCFLSPPPCVWIRPESHCGCSHSIQIMSTIWWFVRTHSARPETAALSPNPTGIIHAAHRFSIPPLPGKAGNWRKRDEAWQTFEVDEDLMKHGKPLLEVQQKHIADYPLEQGSKKTYIMLICSGLQVAMGETQNIRWLWLVVTCCDIGSWPLPCQDPSLSVAERLKDTHSLGLFQMFQALVLNVCMTCLHILKGTATWNEVLFLLKLEELGRFSFSRSQVIECSWGICIAICQYAIMCSEALCSHYFGALPLFGVRLVTNVSIEQCVLGHLAYSAASQQTPPLLPWCNSRMGSKIPQCQVQRF